MLKINKYFELKQNEYIKCFAFGESLHVRYMVLFTTLDHLVIIAEDIYSLEKVTSVLDWLPKDSIVQLRYEEFKLHILSDSCNYYVLTLSDCFRKPFIEQWYEFIVRAKQVSFAEAQYPIKRSLQLVRLRDVVASNIYALGEGIQSISRLKEIDKVVDFIIWPKTSTHLYTILIDRKGNLIFYDHLKGNIPLIYQLRISSQSMTLVDKSKLCILTELNDLIVITLSLKQSRETFIERYESESFSPLIQRFTKPKLSIKGIYFTENHHGKQLLYVHQEHINEQQYLLKYKVSHLQQAKKSYNIQMDDLGYQVLQIVDAPRKVIMLVFDRVQFKIMIFSKPIMKQQIRQLKRSYLFPQHLHALRLVDEQGQNMESYFQKILALGNLQTALLYEHSFAQGEIVLYLTPFTHHYQAKLRKSQLRESLAAGQQLVDKQIKGSIAGSSAVAVSSQRVEILHQQDQKSVIVPVAHFMDGFKGLRLQSNFLLTYYGAESQIINSIEDINPVRWQMQVLTMLWCKINYEEGVPFYVKLKQYIDDKCRQWVEMITQVRPSSLLQLFTQEVPQGAQHNQFERCFAMMVLLSSSFVPRDQLVEYIINQLHPRLHEIPGPIRLSIISHYIENTSATLAQYREPSQHKPLLAFAHWKDKLSYLSLCLIIFELNIAFTMGEYNVAWPLAEKIARQAQHDGPLAPYYTLMQHSQGPSKPFTKLLIESNKLDLHAIMVFAVYHIKILDAKEPLLNRKSLYFLLQLGGHVDMTCMANLISLWEAHYHQTPKRIVPTATHDEDSLLSKITRQLNSPHLYQEGILILMLLAHRLNYQRVISQLAARADKSILWKFECTLWINE